MNTQTTALAERTPDSNVVPLVPSTEPVQTAPDPVKAAADAIKAAADGATASTSAPATTDSVTEGENDVELPLVINGVAVDLSLLWTILSYRRAHGSVGEAAFIKDVLVPAISESGRRWSVLGPTHSDGSLLNFVAVVPKADGTLSDTLFSCHIDTVHSSTAEVQQTMNLDTNFQHVFLSKESKTHGNCLGADNGAGVWILLEMIRFKVPGTYVFHRGEERGCIGSNWIANNKQEWLKVHKRAVAFDRKDNDEVITHQRNKRTCSEKFAMDLATRLSSHNLTYRPSPEGMYTDTAVYEGLISECTNVGVGYSNAHGSSETLDYGHLQNLLEACVKIDWDSLPAERDPKKAEYKSYSGYQGSSYQGSSYQGSAYQGRDWRNGHGSHNHGSQGRGYTNGFDDDDETAHWSGRALGTPSSSVQQGGAAKGQQQQQQAQGGKGKKHKKGAQQAGSQQTPKLLMPMTDPLDDGDISSAFEGSTYAEILETVEGCDSTSVAATVMLLLEEIEGLKSRLAYARRAGGFL